MLKGHPETIEIILRYRFKEIKSVSLVYNQFLILSCRLILHSNLRNKIVLFPSITEFYTKIIERMKRRNSNKFN